MIVATQSAGAVAHRLALLTNHAHVLLLIAQVPDIRMREIASRVGITERAVQRIVEDLTTNRYIAVTKSGRRNRYEIREDCPLMHPVERHRNVGDLVRFLFPPLKASRSEPVTKAS